MELLISRSVLLPPFPTNLAESGTSWTSLRREPGPWCSSRAAASPSTSSAGRSARRRRRRCCFPDWSLPLVVDRRRRLTVVEVGGARGRGSGGCSILPPSATSRWPGPCSKASTLVPCSGLRTTLDGSPAARKKSTRNWFLLRVRIAWKALARSRSIGAFASTWPSRSPPTAGSGLKSAVLPVSLGLRRLNGQKVL